MSDTFLQKGVVCAFSNNAQLDQVLLRSKTGNTLEEKRLEHPHKSAALMVNDRFLLQRKCQVWNKTQLCRYNIFKNRDKV